MRTTRASLALLTAVATTAEAQVTIDRWLVLGPVRAVAPFNAASGDSAVLDASRISFERAWPSSGGTVALPGSEPARWQPGTGAVTEGQSLHAAAYVTTDRWTKATLEVTGGEASTRRIWLDGHRVSGDQVELEPGKHFLLVQRVGRGAGVGEPLSVRVTPTVAQARLAVSLDPRHAGTWQEFKSVASVTDVSVDPTGARFGMVVRRYDAVNDQYTTTLEVRDIPSGRALGEVRPAAAGRPKWAPDGKRMLFAAPTDRQGASGMDLWQWNASDGMTTRLLRAEPGLGVVGFSPDGEWIYFTATTRVGGATPPKPGEARRLTEVWDRWSSFPEKAHLFALHPGAGSRLTLVGDTAVGVSAAALSPDGRSIAFTRTVQTNARRPWLKAEIWTIDVATRAARKVLELPREAFTAPGVLAWSPDSRALAFCASAKELLTREDSTFSVYETRLYATHVERGGLTHLSEGFTPAVGELLGCRRIVWSAADGRIYVPVEDGAKTLPARTRRAVTSALERTTLEVMPASGPHASAFDLAGSILVIATETPTSPAVVSRIDLKSGTAEPIVRPNTEALAQVDLPTWREWSFKNSRGEEIESWYWLPPGFDSTQKYPMIVHYYGGTAAMKKNFEQRLLWFASNGYVVLFMNPAGAPGYGQKFSNYHINDWGWPAASDIIEGTEQFTKTHPFVDAARVGNFGHSYGGFMTMLIHTRSKLFRTGIALAGISNIADYWGSGWTGFSYTEGTCPGCYPWNRKDLFVDRSPLFAADRITAPMLLIHGTDDTNVVPTESEQMFTALRMLGREVELVRMHGENHGIDSKPSVEQLRDGIMLDWFEKQLKGRPEAWSARWGERGAKPGQP